MKLTEYVEADPSRLMSLGKLQQGLAIYNSLKEREKPDCVGSIPNDWNVQIYNIRLILNFMDLTEQKEDARSVTIGFGPTSQIVVKPLGSGPFRLSIDAPSILTWKTSNLLQRIPNLSSSTNTLGQPCVPPRSTRWQMGRTSIPSRVELPCSQRCLRCCLCVGTDTHEPCIQMHGNLLKPDSPSLTSQPTSPKLRRTDTSYHLGKRTPKDEDSSSSDDDWLCSITNNNCKFL